MSDSCVLPDFDDAEAAEYASRLFGLSGPLRRLDGERDLNFRIGEPGTRFVFKIANAGESPAMLECQHLVFEKLAAARVFPRSAKAPGRPSRNWFRGRGAGTGARRSRPA